jgi:hypothetical protein
VRFGELKGFTSLPVAALHEQFRYEDVLTVMPAWDQATRHETVFVATRGRLAILVALKDPRGHWVTRWTPWGSVRIVAPPPPGPDEDVYRLDVFVGSQLFHTQMRGEVGRKALRDFVVAVRTASPTRAARP